MACREISWSQEMVTAIGSAVALGDGVALGVGVGVGVADSVGVAVAEGLLVVDSLGVGAGSGVQPVSARSDTASTARATRGAESVGTPPLSPVG
jgi:hypothetical protein